MKANVTLLQKMQSRLLRKSPMLVRINISKHRSYHPQRALSFVGKSPFCSQIISRYRIEKSNVDSQYFQFLSFFFKPQGKETIRQALVYKEKYLNLKEVQKLSERVLLLQEKEQKKALNQLEKEYIRVKTEYVLQTKELLSYEEKEKLLVEEAKSLSVLKEHELEIRLEKLYIDKVKKETNPYGPKQIALLMQKAPLPEQKKELLGLYMEFKGLQSQQSKEQEDSVDIQGRVEKIFTRIKEYILRSQAFVGKQSASKYVSRRLNQNSKGLYEGIKALEGFVPVITQQNAQPYETRQSLLSRRDIVSIKEQELFIKWKKTDRLLQQYAGSTSETKVISSALLKEHLHKVQLEQIKALKPLTPPMAKKEMARRLNTKVSTYLEYIHAGANLNTQELFALIDASLKSQEDRDLKRLTDKKLQEASSNLSLSATGAMRKVQKIRTEDVYTYVLKSLKREVPFLVVSALAQRELYKKVNTLVLSKVEVTAEHIRRFKEEISTSSLMTSKTSRLDSLDRIESIYRKVQEVLYRENPLSHIRPQTRKRIQHEVARLVSNNTKVTNHDIQILISKLKGVASIRKVLEGDKSLAVSSDMRTSSEDIKLLVSKLKRVASIGKVLKGDKSLLVSSDMRTSAEDIKFLVSKIKGVASIRKVLGDDSESPVKSNTKTSAQEIKLLVSKFKRMRASIGQTIRDDQASDDRGTYVSSPKVIDTDPLAVNSYFVDLRKPRIEELGVTQESKDDLRLISSQDGSSSQEQDEPAMRYIGAGKKITEKLVSKKGETERYLTNKVAKKKIEIEDHIVGVVDNLDSKLDVLATKIFKEIKREIYLELERS